MSRKNALRPLTDRLSDYQRGRRATRVMARSTIAEALARFAIEQTAPMRRGLFGRLWWIVRGLPRPKGRR